MPILLVLICGILNIYPTVCVEFIATTNVMYTLYTSEDLKTWTIVPHYSGYTTDKIETNKLWRGEHETHRFYKIATNGYFVTVPSPPFVATPKLPPPIPITTKGDN